MAPTAKRNGLVELAASCRVPLRALFDFQRSLHRFLNWYLDPRVAAAPKDNPHHYHDIATHLSQSYALLQGSYADSEVQARNKHVAAFPALRESEYLAIDGAYRRKIWNFVVYCREELRPYVDVALLHGSQSDCNYVHGWSDLDTFLVIKDEVLTDRTSLWGLHEVLRKAWPLFEDVCRYQHHGFLFIGAFELSFYPTSYMPIQAFEHARSLLPDSQVLEIRYVQEGGGARRSLESRLQTFEVAQEQNEFRHHAKGGVYLRTDFSGREDNMYQLFAYLNYLMLVPSLVLDAIGSPCYKGESFASVKKYFDSASVEHLATLSDIRQRWGQEEGVDKVDNGIPGWVERALGPAFIEAGYELLRDAVSICARYGSPSA